MPYRKEQQELEREILELTDKLIENTIETSMLTGEEFAEKQREGVNIVAKLADVLEQYLGGSPEHFEQVIQELTKQKLPDENVLKSFGDFKLHLEEAIQKGLQLYHDNRLSVNNEESTEMTSCSQEETEQIELNNNINITQEANDHPEEIVETADEAAYVETKTSDTVIEKEERACNDREEEIAEAALPEHLEIDTVTSVDHTYEASEPSEPDNTANIEDDNGEELKTGTFSPQEDHWMQALKLVFPGATIMKNHTLKGLSFSYYIPEYSIAIDLNQPNKKEAVWKEYFCRQERIKHMSVDTTENTRIRHIVRNLKRSLAQNTNQNIS